METGAFIILNGEIFGEQDTTRLKKAKWYQKIIARLSKRYKNKFIDIVPFKNKPN